MVKRYSFRRASMSEEGNDLTFITNLRTIAVMKKKETIEIKKKKEKTQTHKHTL